VEKPALVRVRSLVTSGLALACIAACSAPAKPPPHGPGGDVPDEYGDRVAFVTNNLYRADPASAVSLGLHKFDGLLPDRTPASLDEERKQLDRDKELLLAVPAASLTPAQREEREVLLFAIATRRFSLVDLDVYRTNPRSYLDAINLDAYILRDYAPAVERAAAAIKLCQALPAYLQQARTNLVGPLVRPWIDTALAQTRGLVEFADKDVRQAFDAITPPLANQAELGPALATCKAALTEHADWLAKQQARGTQQFALGEQKFLAMLAATQGVTIDLARLSRIADADLARNLTALAEAARAIAPNKSVLEVVAAQAEIRPTIASLISLATEQTAAARAFMLEHRIASEPSTDVAEVRETPPFKRWNSAFLEAPGAFETKPLPAFYYISPPDPKWPEAEQKAYLPPTSDLLFTTIHEVYPGHFLHRQHIARHPSRAMRSFCTYSTSEGWAHYTEEMMFEAGMGGKTPEARIGMLKEALLRNVRFVATISLHTRGMTVDEAAKLFAEKGFVDAANARQQAVRGTFDPMYLAYTLGKLMVGKLRTDWLAANPGKSLGDFHDAFLAHACAPIPVIRRAMLGPDAGPPL
ncbi:MAG: DUF885 domain-containing protein, partial [Kofleriaceae bacterium]|nr:DUF885 domain-containing protein [Kofleriaceae bacterium]